MKVLVYYREWLTYSTHPDDPLTIEEIVLYIPDVCVWIMNDGYDKEYLVAETYHIEARSRHDEHLVCLGEL